MKIKILMWVLWPSFIVAGLAEGLIFTLVNPADLVFFDQPVDIPKEGVYTLGFFVLWFFCALSSAMTLFIIPESWRVDSTDPVKPMTVTK